MAMRLDTGKTDIRINLSFAAAVTLMLLFDESGICALALLSCVVHEAGHIVCLWTMGEFPSKIVLSFYGIKLERLPAVFHGRKNEIIIFAAGPMANILLSVILMLVSAVNKKLELWAAVSLCVGIFNLLPCRPLDGGNIAYSLLCGYTDEARADGICKTVSFLTVVPMLAAGAVLAVKFRNFTLIATGAYLIFVLFEDKKYTGCS